MLLNLTRAHDVRVSATYIDKTNYTGPYLAAGAGTKFRNFQLRRLLEWHFKGIEPISSHCELVLDRHSRSHLSLDKVTFHLTRRGMKPPPEPSRVGEQELPFLGATGGIGKGLQHVFASEI